MLVAIGNPVTFPQMGHSRSRTKNPFFLELQYCMNKGERKGAVIFQFQNMTSKIRSKYVWKGCSLYILLSNKNKNQVSSDSSQMRRRKPEGIWGKPHANSGSLEQTDGHETAITVNWKS